jgi:hypothetical protein
MIKFRSKSERTTADYLNLAELQYKFEPYYIQYTWLEYKKYLPDFVLPNGIIVEVKGRFTLEDRKKHMFLKETHPDLDVRFVFDNPKKKLNKGGKSTYADWCLKNGFQFTSLAEVSVVEKWYNERGRSISSGSRTDTGKSTKSRTSTLSKRNTSSTSRRNKA